MIVANCSLEFSDSIFESSDGIGAKLSCSVGNLLFEVDVILSSKALSLFNSKFVITVHI